MKKIISCILLFALVFSISACAQKNDENEAETTTSEIPVDVDINYCPSSLRIELGEEELIGVSYDVSPRNAEVDVNYVSSNEEIATVDDSGMVTAVSEGTCKITVTVGNESASVDIVVTYTPTYHVGDTVSTDRIEFTLDSVELAYAVSDTPNNSYASPTDNYDNTEFVAAVGETFIVLEVSIRNTGSSAINNAFDAWNWNWYVEYQGETYYLHRYNFGSLDTYYAARYSRDESAWTPINNARITIHGTDIASRYRIPAIIDTDISDFDAPFTFTVGVVNSEGNNEYFTYSIND